MSAVRAVHTADLDTAMLDAVRRLLFDVFEGEFTNDDFDHALGGMHALAWEGAELVGHASLIQRRLLVGGRALRAGYAEGVAVRADRRGRGYGTALMAELERIVRSAYDLGALSSAARAAGFYEARGWKRWAGPTSALTPAGSKRTPDDDGSIHVLAVATTLDATTELTCDWREGEVW